MNYIKFTYKILFWTIISSILLLSFRALAQTNCQAITAYISGSSPAMTTSDSLIRICQNQSITFYGTVTFQVTGVGAKYIWNVSDGSADTTTTASFTHTFTTGGIFSVDLSVIDSSGCTGCGTRQMVYVSTTPIFAGTSGSEPICIYKPNTLTGIVTPVPAVYNCAPPVSDTTFLPDGSGVSYTTSINVTCFNPCDTMASGLDISDLCINMEHSYFGDLDIKITCPDGKTSRILRFGDVNNSVYFGEPNDFGCTTPGVTDMTPGVGYTYCFKNNATWGTLDQENLLGNFVPNVGCPASNSMKPGEYKPKQSFDSLIGCHLDGQWTITITDEQLSDNGYIFFWNINFNRELPTYANATPNYTQKWWTGPFITDTVGDNIVITPDSAGDYCYNFYVKDDVRDCIYDTTICVHVEPQITDEIFDTVCYGQTKYGYSQQGIYYDTFQAASGCDSVRILHLYANPEITLSLGDNREACQYDTIRLEPNITPYNVQYRYKWSPAEGLALPDTVGNNYFLVDTDVTYQLVITSPLGCTDTDQIRIQAHTVDFSLLTSSSDTGICPGDSIQIHVIGQGNLFKWIPSDGLSNDTIADPWVYPTYTRDYTLFTTSQFGCKDTQKVHINAYPAATIVLPDSGLLYPGQRYKIEPVTNTSIFTWTPNFNIDYTNIATPSVAPTRNLTYFVDAFTDYGCEAKDSIHIILKGTAFGMPNAFAPTYEGTLKPAVQGIVTLSHFIIYNRWGNKVFESTDINAGWDGTYKGSPQPTGVYVYDIEGAYDDGTPIHQSGNITLVR